MRYDNLDDAIAEAIRYCVGNGIMKEFLEANGSEVCNMLYTEWDWDQALAISKEEGFEDGKAEGVVYGEKKKQEELIRKFSAICTAEQIAETLHVSKAYVMDVLQTEGCVCEPQATYEVKKQEQ